ncbi:MAG: hypothetical protein JXK07_06515 [Spirochaetes bacterium]|nr:hypothetical protein [Spirochaetota bacterium]
MNKNWTLKKTKFICISVIFFFASNLLIFPGVYEFQGPIELNTGDIQYFRVKQIGENFGVAFKDSLGRGLFSLFSETGDILLNQIEFTNCILPNYNFDMYYDEITNHVFILYTCRTAWFSGYITTIDLTTGNIIGHPLDMGLSPRPSAQEFNVVARLDGIQGFAVLASRGYDPQLYLIGTSSGYPNIDFHKQLEPTNTYALYLRGATNGQNYAVIGRSYNPNYYTFRLYNQTGGKITDSYRFYRPKVVTDLVSDGKDFYVYEYEEYASSCYPRIHKFKGDNGEYLGEMLFIDALVDMGALLLNSQIAPYLLGRWHPADSAIEFYDADFNFIDLLTDPVRPEWNSHNHNNVFVDRSGRVVLFVRDITQTKLNMFILGKKTVEVDIDIKPGSSPNSINLKSKGNVPVAIFSTDEFDAASIDPSMVTLAEAPVIIKKNGKPMASFEDVNGDGLQDMIVHIDTTTLQLSSGDIEAVLEGETFDGQKIRGTDTVRIVHE